MFKCSLSFALLFSALSSVLLTLTVTVWDWLENPGGLFRGADGTRWPVVAETALSWLVPGFLYLAVTGLVVHLLVSALGRRTARRSAPSADEVRSGRACNHD